MRNVLLHFLVSQRVCVVEAMLPEQPGSAQTTTIPLHTLTLQLYVTFTTTLLGSAAAPEAAE